MNNFLRSLFAVGAREDAVPVIAEVAWAHDGSLELGKVIVDGAADAGAHAINFHVTDLADYMVPSYRAGEGRTSVKVSDVYRYLERINLSFAQFAELAEHARNRKLRVSMMPNDFASLRFSAGAGKADIITVHPSCIFDESFVRSAAAVGVPLILYTGGLTLGEVDKVVTWAASEGNERLILQHGFQSYPTPVRFNRLRYIKTLKRAFGWPVSFADHTDGDDPMAMIVPLLAITAGADLIEKHMTHDRSKKGEDYEAALDPRGMKTFMAWVEQAIAALGSPHAAPLSDPELKYREVVRKRAVFVRPVAKGALLSRDMVSYRRSDAGLYPEEVEQLFGKVVVAADADENAAVDWTLLARHA
jgi:sialic acid synthase SpsE